MFDLHLHSTASDGDVSPREVVAEVKRRGLTGLALTDHNGVWGVDEAASAAQGLGLQFIEGIEITARYREADVHVLGYSRAFDREVLEAGLADTRAGYEARLQEMVRLCQQAGYTKISWERIRQRRAHLANPCFVSFDMARELAAQYQLDLEAARRMTVTGGVCHVPYGEWAMSPAAAVDLIHRSGGVASLAHPGTIEHEHGRDTLLAVLQEAVAVRLDALEVVHPFHAEEYQAWLKEAAATYRLASTGGSDWHGPDHLPQNAAVFGRLGVEQMPVIL